MKNLTLLTLCAGAGLIASTAMAAPCQYTVLQNMIRDARSHEQIFELIRAGVSVDDPTVTCGGSTLQLAIRRGNPSILNGILSQDKKRINAQVSLADFPITDAPKEIPALLFAAYYAPSETVFKVMIDNGADVSVKDSNGHDILWYLDQNPVLRQSPVEDTVKQMLKQKLFDLAKVKNTPVSEDPKTPNVNLNADTLNQ